MDPNTTLAELRELCSITGEENYSERIAELFEALDQWLSRGGSLPTDWNVNR